MLINNELTNKILKNDIQIPKNEKKLESAQNKKNDIFSSVDTNDVKIKTQHNYDVSVSEADDILKSVQGNLSSFSTADVNELLGGLNNTDVLALLKEN
ncbi:MAG: hypothetical protein QMC67_14005 [Candidatus Wallbacteria bacterium]